MGRGVAGDCWLGLDLGGSHISVVALDVRGAAVHRAGEPVNRLWTHDRIIARMVALLRDAADQCRREGYRVAAAGVGLPGVVDLASGTALFLPNLPGQWRGVPVRAMVAEGLGVPVAVVNDARAFTVAEHQHGAGRGSGHMLGLVIGTGIGGGLILDGRPYLGAERRAGEMGHTTVDPNGLPCGCGNRGCLETIASGPAIAAAAARVVLQGHPSTLGTLVDHDLNRLTPQVVGAAAAEGDAAALAVIRRAGEAVGIAMANLIEVLNPECVVIGGGVALAGEPLFDAIRQTVRERARTVDVDNVRIVPATLGIDAGMIGAAVWARDYQEVT